MKTARICAAAVALLIQIAAYGQTVPISPPPAGKLYHGCYWGGVGTDDHDPTEHDVTASDVAAYEQAVGAKAAWVYFSNNWFESRAFPAAMCGWIREAGKTPYIRLMLRSDVDQKHSEKTFTLARIIAGDFDDDLRSWARSARAFDSPLLIEWGTEPNGNWFSWNGKWNGGPVEGPRRYIEAYRHIVDIMRGEKADNLQWVWHVNWLDEPERKWNAFENYFPGANYCDWVGISAYGPTTPTTSDGTESFRFKLRNAYPRLTAVAPGKPVIIAEFGCDVHNPHIDASAWAKAALDDLFADRWPAIVGFCWWNEGWQNDERKKHDSDLIILHESKLQQVFREEFGSHSNQLQQAPVLSH